MSTANLAQYGVSQGNVRQLFGEALVALGQANPDVVVLDCQTAMPTAAVAFAKAFPDRFMVGTDTFVPERWHYVPEHATWSRAWLAELPPDVAEKIAWKNGEAVIGEAFDKKRSD